MSIPHAYSLVHIVSYSSFSMVDQHVSHSADIETPTS